MEAIRKEDPKTLLVTGAQQLGVPLSLIQTEQLLTYLSELIRWNKKVNLTALRQEREIIIKHFLDSFMPLAVLNLEEGTRWVDVGTGAGFPGLVLKIAEPKLQMTLVEGREKKVAFLHHIIGRLGLAQVLVIQDRLEHLALGDLRGSFDLLLSRALSPRLVLEEGRPLVRPGGKILLFQAHANQKEWAQHMRDLPGMRLEEIYPITLPFSQDPRALVLLRVT